MKRKKMLMLAAKAYGLKGRSYDDGFGLHCVVSNNVAWNYLDNFLDSMLLAAKLDMHLEFNRFTVLACATYNGEHFVCEKTHTNNEEKMEMMRYCITRVAAEIGKTM